MLVRCHMLDGSASFLSGTPEVFVDEKVLQRSEQECAELAPAGMNTTDEISRDECREKLLHEVTRVLRMMTAPEDVLMQWLPVAAAKLVQRQQGVG